MSPYSQNTSVVVSMFALLSLASAGQLRAQEKQPTIAPGRQVTNFNADWKFTKGDPAGAEKNDFNDGGWEAIRLPHDWAIAGPFDPNVDGFAGKLPWRGVGWYRKTFTVDNAGAGGSASANAATATTASGGPPVVHNVRRVYFDFGGVMAFPKVYINGKLAGGWDYGYMSFRVDATPFIKFGEPNVIAVRADTMQHGTRWYPGAGIYRSVTMSVCDPVHLAHWGTVIATQEVKDEAATLEVKTSIENHTDKAASVELMVNLHHPNPELSSLAAAGFVLVTIPPTGTANATVPLAVKNPKRWDVSDPQLYKARLIVRRAESGPQQSQLIDDETINVGIRTFEFTADDGFHLNGRRVQLYGVDLHHDQGALGGAFYTRSMERQLEIMKEMGVNAIRTSHNAPAPEVLDVCDRMGILVWDECFDKWNETSGRVPVAPAGGSTGQAVTESDPNAPRRGRGPELQPPLLEHGEKQLSQLVRRDRNHPSVVIWSMANEIGEIGGLNGLTAERVSAMRDFVRKHDTTRPVVIGHHVVETGGTPIFASLDAVGYNYDRRYRLLRETYPKMPIIYSESASALSTRGFYQLPLPTSKTDYSAEHQVDSYDYNAAPWSDIADLEFNLMELDKFVAGEFVWTGIDYLGEPTPFAKQARSSYFGIVDLAGFPKDRFYLYRSHWRPNSTTVHILPHWNWPDRVGKNVPVFVYTNGDNAELFLNGKSLGKRQKKESVPIRTNIGLNKPATASSQSPAPEAAARFATDGLNTSIWRAQTNAVGQWYQVDLGKVEPLREVMVSFAANAADYKYQIKTSRDGESWETVANQDQYFNDMGNRLAHGMRTEGRYVRVEFTGLRTPETPVGLRDVLVFPSEYHEITEKYRLKWMDVVYEPGELKVVAYKGSWPIGEAIVRTVGSPAALKVTPDRTELAASGEDLCYITVEAVDERGDVCPLADNRVRFKVEGPGDYLAADNGDPLSLEVFHQPDRKLFFGKAIAIVRAKAGAGGEIRLTAESDGLRSDTATAVARP